MVVVVSVVVVGPVVVVGLRNVVVLVSVVDVVASAVVVVVVVAASVVVVVVSAVVVVVGTVVVCTRSAHEMDVQAQSAKRLPRSRSLSGKTVKKRKTAHVPVPLPALRQHKTSPRTSRGCRARN